MTTYKKIAVHTFFLEKQAPFECNDIPKNEGLTLRKIEEVATNHYREIYINVGGKYGWASRLMLTEEELQKTLNRTENRLYFLEKNGNFAGFFEAEVYKSKTELLYFGLDEKYLGKGLGKVLMQYVFCKARQWNTESLSLHTCEYDHKAALPFYKKMGFEVKDEKVLKEYYPMDYLKAKKIQT
jgi:GNAT superfamily N-acetyltransferase